MEATEDRKEKEKSPYHAPHLETYGDISELTKTASGSGAVDGTGRWGQNTQSL